MRNRNFRFITVRIMALRSEIARMDREDRLERLSRLLAEPEGTVTPLSTSAVKYHTDTGLLTPMMSTNELEEKLERMKEQGGFYGPTGDDFEEYLDD